MKPGSTTSSSKFQHSNIIRCKFQASLGGRSKHVPSHILDAGALNNAWLQKMLLLKAGFTKGNDGKCMGYNVEILALGFTCERGCVDILADIHSPQSLTCDLSLNLTSSTLMLPALTWQVLCWCKTLSPFVAMWTRWRLWKWSLGIWSWGMTEVNQLVLLVIMRKM